MTIYNIYENNIDIDSYEITWLYKYDFKHYIPHNIDYLFEFCQKHISEVLEDEMKENLKKFIKWLERYKDINKYKGMFIN